jgi:hypothetical protein
LENFKSVLEIYLYSQENNSFKNEKIIEQLENSITGTYLFLESGNLRFKNWKILSMVLFD